MKKVVAILLAVGMVFCLMACNTTHTDDATDGTSAPVTNGMITENSIHTTTTMESIMQNSGTATENHISESSQIDVTTSTSNLLLEEPSVSGNISPTTMVTTNKQTTVTTTFATVKPTSPHKHVYAAGSCDEPPTCSCGATNGSARGHTYVLGECTVCQDYSSSYCPKLYFVGNMSQMNSKSDVRNISFEYRSKQQKVTGAAKIKVQGTSSLAYEKKNYTINFYENGSYTQKMKVDVGWGAQNEYCLKANWIDKTHSRNVVSAELAGKIQKSYGLMNDAPNNGAIDGFPVEIYINGSFHGLYTMNIPKDAWMFGMDENNPTHIAICGENWTDPVLFKAIPTDFSGWGVEVGPENGETLQKIQRLVRFVRDSSDSDFKANFDQYLNLDSTLNYYVLMNYGWMSDNMGKNMLLVTYDGKVWYPSLYDLDTTWGTNWKGDGIYNYEKMLLSTTRSLLWERMEKLYKKEIAQRYFELRATYLDPDYVMSRFRLFANSIPQEVLKRETAKWNTSQTPIPGYPISQIQEYLDAVVPRLDEKYKEWK